MSYNITSLKVKELEMTLPLNFNFPQWVQEQPESAGKKWCLQEDDRIWVDLAEQTWKLTLAGHEIGGVITNSQLVATTLECSGEGSGHIYHDILLPLFVTLKGNLTALIVWGGGDSIYDLKIEHGVVEETKIG